MNIKEKNIICLTGLTGTGKTTVKKIFEENGVTTFYTKDLHNIAFKTNDIPEDKMAGAMFFKKKYGFIKNIMDYIKEQDIVSSIVLLDSVRSTAELEYIKSLGFKSFTLIKTHTNEKERLKRLIARDNCSVVDIERRDSIDLGIDSKYGYNIAEVFTYADYTINTTNSLAEVKAQVLNIIQSISGVKTMNDKDMELEIKFKANQDFSQFLIDKGFLEKKHKHQIDTYYIVDEVIDDKRSWLRLREDKESGKVSLDFHKLISEYATDETEVTILSEDSKKIKNIMKNLGHNIKCVVDKDRRAFKYGNVEVTLDNVKGLGHFVEIEIIGEEKKENIAQLKAIAKAMGFNEEDRISDGYPEMLIKKNQSINNIVNGLARSSRGK